MRPTLRTLALVLAAAALPLSAQGFRHGRGPAGGPGPLFRCLDLTDAQKATLKALREKYRPALESGRAAAFEAQKGLRAAMADPATSEADLKALYDKAAAARFAMLKQHRALLQESLAVLTPDQRAAWDKRRAEVQQRMQDRRPGWGPGPGGPGPDLP